MPLFRPGLGRLLALFSLGAALTLATPALARPARRPGIVWSSVTVREGQDRDARERELAIILAKEGRRARWGKARSEPVEASIEVRELTTVVDHGVVRVTCAAVGKIRGLGAARSKFSYGGRPSDRAQLERHVLELVARGIVSRLADLARADDEQRHASWKVARAPKRHQPAIRPR